MTSSSAPTPKPHTNQADEAVEWLDEHEQRAWIALLEVGAGLFDRLSQDLKKASGITLEDYEIFHLLSQEPEHRLRIGTLTDRLLASRTRVSQRIDRLAERGFLQRVPCPGDGRAINVVLTDEGYRFLTEIAPLHLASARTHVFAHWDDDDVRNVGHSLSKLAAYLRANPN
jgi:DNA-binding MarR family transcriptional regulator